LKQNVTRKIGNSYFYEGYLEQKILNCNYKFDKKILYINNVEDLDLVKKEADKLVSKSLIDSYYVVEEYADRVLKYFNIEEESFKGGYYYSIAELTSIYLCDTEYLLHFSSDSYPNKNLNYDWIDKGIKLLKEDSKVVVVNPGWYFEDAATDTDSREWSYEKGFSDQAYLIETAFFKRPIYNEYHPASDRFPEYGGELFEKRVDSFIQNHDVTRANSRYVHYTHKNFI
jgi:hypothetical protein